jgi:hypothetical protein
VGGKSVATRERTRRVYGDTPRGLGVWCGRMKALNRRGEISGFEYKTLGTSPFTRLER